MDVGIAFDLRSDFHPAPGAPIDRLEEYDSRETVDAIARALVSHGHHARLIGGGRRFVETALADPPELVFNIAEGWGTRSREAHVPAVCEMLGIPFTHSDPLTLAVTLDKVMAKRICASHDVPTAPFAVVDSLDDLADVRLAYPLFVKPACEGSSMGIRRSSRVVDAGALAAEVARNLADYGGPVLIETFLPGIEATVGVLGNGRSAEVLGVMEIAPKKARADEFVYGLETKRAYLDEVAYHVPPKSVPAAVVREIEQVALRAFAALGCRDVARVDVRLDARGVPNFIEVNPLPGLSPVSGDLVIMTKARGGTFEELIGRIVDGALARLARSAAGAGDAAAP
jgi:D-alanine-D-alanine ligase